MKPFQRFFLGIMLAPAQAVGCLAVVGLIVVMAVSSIVQLAAWYVGLPLLAAFAVFQLVKAILARRKLSVVHAPALEAARVEIRQPVQPLLEEHKGPQKW